MLPGRADRSRGPAAAPGRCRRAGSARLRESAEGVGDTFWERAGHRGKTRPYRGAYPAIRPGISGVAATASQHGHGGAASCPPRIYPLQKKHFHVAGVCPPRITLRSLCRLLSAGSPSDGCRNRSHRHCYLIRLSRCRLKLHDVPFLYAGTSPLSHTWLHEGGSTNTDSPDTSRPH